jgi:hypothetical protein
MFYTQFFLRRDESAQKITVFYIAGSGEHLYTKKVYFIYTNYVVCVFMLSIAIKNLLFFFICMTTTLATRRGKKSEFKSRVEKFYRIIKSFV